MSDSITVSTAEEPELTKDTNAQFSVSDTENQDPQSTEYNTTPEVLEYQKAEDAKSSLEAYIGLLGQAADGVSVQTEAVMRVQLNQIDRLIGRVVVGLESYSTGPRSALRRSAITRADLTQRLDDLCTYLNQHVATEDFHIPAFGLEDDAPADSGDGSKGLSILQRFWAWLRSVFQRVKEAFSDKWQSLKEYAETAKRFIDLLPSTAYVTLQIPGNLAWAGDDYVGNTVEREKKVIDWLTGNYEPWQEVTWAEAGKFIESLGGRVVDERSDNVVEEWADRAKLTVPPPDVVIGGSFKITMADGLKLEVEKTEEAHNDLQEPPKLSAQEAKKLIDDVHMLIKRGEHSFGKAFKEREIKDPHQNPVYDTYAPALARLMRSLSLYDAVAFVWPRLHSALHAKVTGVFINAKKMQEKQVEAKHDTMADTANRRYTGK